MLYNIIFLITILCNSISYASSIDKKRLHITIGTDLFQMQYNEQRYKFDNYDAFKNPYNNIKRITLGVNYQPFEGKHLYLGIRTNRGVNYETQTVAYDTMTNQNVGVQTKLKADSIFVATAVHKYIIPYFAVSSIHTNTNIKYDNGFVVNSKKNSILYGFGIAVPFKEKHSLAFTYFLPNAKYNAKRTFGLSYNYYFASI